MLFGAAFAVVPFSYSPTASAVTSGIVTSDLALNLDPNLSASYSGTGVTVTDLSGVGRNGTLAGTPLPTFSSSSPKSFVFQKEYVGDTASTANKISVGGNFLTDDFTLQTWIKTNEVGYSSAHYTTMYIMASECGGGAPDWGLGVNNSGQLAFGAGWSDQTFETSELVNSNEWINVAASRKMATGEIKLYIDGVLKATGNGQSGNSLTCSADGNTWIGNGQDAPAYSFGGKISTPCRTTQMVLHLVQYLLMAVLPQVGRLPRLLQTLVRFNVLATHFLVGTLLQTEMARRMPREPGRTQLMRMSLSMQSGHRFQQQQQWLLPS
jgi:hypothetical protein